MSVFDREHFANPANEFRPLQIVHGFDAYLTDPEHLAGEEGIDRRLDKLQSMGLGGVVANVGFRDYLVSPRQWDIFRYGMRKASERGLELWWYDEKGYPSGTAGGQVLEGHPEWEPQGLLVASATADGPITLKLPPGTLLLAAACYARGSKRLHRLLLQNRFFGRHIKDYIERRGVSPGVKLVLPATMWGTIAYSAVFVARHAALKALLASVALLVSLHIVRLKTLTKRRDPACRLKSSRSSSTTTR